MKKCKKHFWVFRTDRKWCTIYCVVCKKFMYVKPNTKKFEKFILGY